MQLSGGQRSRHNDTDVQRERERKREAKTAEQEDPEKVGVNPRKCDGVVDNGTSVKSPL